MLTFGMISAGFAFFYNIQIAQAARDAARFGSTWDMQGELDDGLLHMAEIAAQQSGWSSFGAVPADALVCVAYIGPPGNGSLPVDGEPCFEDDQPPPKVQVRITRPSELNAVLFSWDLTLETRAVIPYELRSTE